MGTDLDTGRLRYNEHGCNERFLYSICRRVRLGKPGCNEFSVQRTILSSPKAFLYRGAPVFSNYQNSLQAFTVKGCA